MIGGAFYLLIWTYAIQYTHEQVAVNNRLQHTDQKRHCDLEAFVFLDSLHADTDDRNMSITVFGQCSSDEADIVRGATSATGLGDQNGSFIQIIFA